MREWLSSHRFAMVVVLLLVLPLLLMYLHGRRSGGTTLFERMAMSLAGASQSAVGSIVDGVSSLLQDYAFLVGVQAENERLKMENERLLERAIEAKRLAAGNRELVSLLGLADSLDRRGFVAARVIGRELTPYFKVARLSLELGSGDFEVAPDMAVVTSKGLLGRVVSVAGSYADVMLLSDRRSRVACEVLGRGVLGILVGHGSSDGYGAGLRVSASESSLEEGMVVQTSGHDRVFPRGIEVGYVANVASRRQAGPFTEYDVILAVNPGAVEYAMVLEGPGPRRAAAKE